MTDFKKISLQFLKFFAANFFAIAVFALIYLCSYVILNPIAGFLPKFLTYTHLPYFIWGVVPFIVSMFLTHCLYGTMVFKTAGNLTPVEIFKEVIVFGFNITSINLIVVFLTKGKFGCSNVVKLMILIFICLTHVFLAIVYYLINKFWIFEKAESED